MQHELEARTRQSMKEQIADLEASLNAIHEDFAKCAKGGISPCYFCANDDNCAGTPETCKFKWIERN